MAFENPNQTDAQKNAPQMENGKPVVPATYDTTRMKNSNYIAAAALREAIVGVCPN
jgi:hypothetical protein